MTSATEMGECTRSLSLCNKGLSRTIGDSRGRGESVENGHDIREHRCRNGCGLVGLVLKQITLVLAVAVPEDEEHDKDHDRNGDHDPV